MIEKFPEWHYILVHFNREKTIEEVSELAQILQNYNASNPKMELDPLLTAAKSNQMDTVEFLLLRIYLDPKSISTLIEKFPDWCHILHHFYREKSLEEFSKLAQIIHDYIARNPKMDLDPLLTAAKSNQWETVNFLLPRIQTGSESNKRYLLKIIGDILNGDFKNQGNNLKDPSYREFTRMICE